MVKSRSFDYSGMWGSYIDASDFEKRFLSMEREDLLKICDEVEVSSFREVSRLKSKFSGGIPVSYRDGKLYTLKTGPHSRICGESGSKKSRTVMRGSIISAALNRDSIVVTDPKGELFSDPKIRWLLNATGHRVHVIDFRRFDKDGFNPLSFAFELYVNCAASRAISLIDNFVAMLITANAGAADPFWNSQAGDLIRSALQLLLFVLSGMKDGHKYFNLLSLRRFISQDQYAMRSFANDLMRCKLPEEMSAALKLYRDILYNPEKTYACIVSSANALLSALCSSSDLLTMLSRQSINVREMYAEPTALFLVIPDEVKTYDVVTGYMIDTIHHILIDEYTQNYQNKRIEPDCGIHMLCDEVASVFISDLSSKVSASRSRLIDWVLVYQSEKQLAAAYSKDYGTICGNCKNYLFLGSSDHDILADVSAQTGSSVTASGRVVPLVTVDDLRAMKKTREYKDALIRTDDYILCARLPDYDTFPFLKADPDAVAWEASAKQEEILEYTPQMLLEHYQSKSKRFL